MFRSFSYKSDSNYRIVPLLDFAPSPATAPVIFSVTLGVLPGVDDTTRSAATSPEMEISDSELAVLRKALEGQGDTKWFSEGPRQDVDSLWMLVAAFFVFIMQCGFALVETGSVHERNARNILLKNTLDACLGALLWWSVGHGFAFGEGGTQANPFVGTTNFFTSTSGGSVEGQSTLSSEWLLSWTFAATAATIVSGAMAERCLFRAYVVYTIFMTGLVYPIVAHWVWSKEGWLSPFRIDSNGEVRSMVGGMGVMDFAGSGVVHITGGGAALVGAYILGPRVGRFKDGKVVDMPGSSPTLVTVGVFVLWFGWYAFNAGSTHCVVSCMDLAARTSISTTISAATGGVTVLLVYVLGGRPADVRFALNGILSGLVSITAACAVVEPYGAFIIGVIGGLIFCGASKILKVMGVDDPLEASPIHFFCGLWGVVAVGFLATEEYVQAAYKRNEGYGVLYGSGFSQLGIQCLGMLAISAWTIACNAVLFYVLRRYGWLRVNFDDEVRDLDICAVSRNGGSYVDDDRLVVTRHSDERRHAYSIRFDET